MKKKLVDDFNEAVVKIVEEYNETKSCACEPRKIPDLSKVRVDLLSASERKEYLVKLQRIVHNH